MTGPGYDGELRELWRDYRATGDSALRNRLVLQYAPLVKFVAGRLRSRLPEHLDPEDLVSDGVVGLMDAIARFQPDRGLTFQTFAVPRIRGAMVDGLRAMDLVPRSVRAKVREVQQAQVLLEQRLGRTPEDEELAAEVGLTLPELRDLYASVSIGHTASLDGFDLADDLAAAAHDGVEDSDAYDTLLRVVEELPERDRIVIALYYFDGLTLAEVGQVLGVSEARVSQVHSRATLMLRTKIRALEEA
ncbi:MAG: FliA/WhiG family RNA polymerase sigma factor [Nocardioidaceae bacterium]